MILQVVRCSLLDTGILLQVAIDTFEWINETPLVLSNWRSGQPDAMFPNQTCVYARASKEGKWQDVTCTIRKRSGVARLPLCERVISSGTIKANTFQFNQMNIITIFGVMH